MRDDIPPEIKLALTIRVLATGNYSRISITRMLKGVASFVRVIEIFELWRVGLCLNQNKFKMNKTDGIYVFLAIWAYYRD